MTLLLSDHWIFWLCAMFGLLIAFLFIIAPFTVKNNSNQLSLKSGVHTGIIVASMMGVMLGSIGLYQYYGALDGLEDKAVINQIAKTLSELQSTQTVSRDMVLDRLMKLEAQLPKRGSPWSYLAGVYQHLGFLDQAAIAYHQAAKLSPKVLAYVTQEAYLFSRMNQGLLSAQMKAQLEMVLKKEANNQDILNLLAIHAYQQKEYPVAIKYWQSLLTQENLSSEDKQTIILMMATARKHIGASTL